MTIHHHEPVTYNIPIMIKNNPNLREVTDRCLAFNELEVADILGAATLSLFAEQPAQYMRASMLNEGLCMAANVEEIDQALGIVREQMQPPEAWLTLIRKTLVFRLECKRIAKS